MGNKRFNILANIGKAKHVVSFHDGIKTHNDGSDFFDIEILKNKKSLKKFTQKLADQGYVERVGQ